MLRRKAFSLITEIMDARGEYSAEDRARMQRVAAPFRRRRPTEQDKNPLESLLTNRMEKPAKAS